MSILTAYDKFIQQALKYGFSLWGTTKTGQTTSYRTGDDGYFEKGYPRDPPRFKDNGGGTITDMASGLMWVKEPGAIGGNFGSAGSPAKMTWNNAIDECPALTYAGHSDWRLPNIKELASIIDHGKSSPSIDTVFFPSTQTTKYWSSTTLNSFSGVKWYVAFDEGEISVYTSDEPWYLRPVRLGIPKA